jgi:hypothetical protein
MVKHFGWREFDWEGITEKDACSCDWKDSKIIIRKKGQADASDYKALHVSIPEKLRDIMYRSSRQR